MHSLLVVDDGDEREKVVENFKYEYCGLRGECVRRGTVSDR